MEDKETAGHAVTGLEDKSDGREKPYRSPSVLELETEGKYPPDTYCMMMLCSPCKNPQGYFFGVMVFSFQALFLLLLVLNVLYPKWSSIDNSDGSHIFVPGDVEPVVRFCQYLAVFAFALFADDSIMDVITAIDMMPKLSKVRNEDRVFPMILSNILRAIQGGLAIIVSFLLIFTSGNVLDIILNFTAVNFISSMDGQAFELAQKGHYGDTLREIADEIEETDLPPCVLEKRYNFLRKNVLLAIFMGTMACIGGAYSMAQAKGGYLTERLRIEFDPAGILARYNGCYSSSASIPKSLNGNRFTYDYWDQEKDDIFKFGYCKAKRQWVFFETTETVDNFACKAIDEGKVLAYSSSTTAFDIADTFSNPWFSGGGTPLNLNFLEKSWSDEECGQFFGDGICYEPFNSIDFEYDRGDCCGSTCEIRSLCGVQKLESAFDTQLKSVSDGFSICNNPDMVDIAIKIEDIKKIEYVDQYSEYVNTTPPLLILECNDKLHLLLKLEDEMVKKTETVKVRDGASCKITVRKAIDLSEVVYKINHRLESNDEVMILEGNSKKSEVKHFQVVPRCYFRKLSDHLEQDAIYSLENSPSRAVDWLLNDKTGNSDCENPFFIERYALAVINFEAPAQNKTEDDGLWIQTNRQCNWPNIVCDGGYIDEVIFNGYNISGVIATEYGLLTNLRIISSNYMSLTGTIPSELGSLAKLEGIFLRGYKFVQKRLTGTLPPELAKLSELKDLFLSSHSLTGPIPPQFGQMNKLKYLDLFANLLTGTIPSELGGASDLRIIQLYNNLLTGTIPSHLGRLSKLKSLTINGNYNATDKTGLQGTLPSELGDLSSLESIDIRRLGINGTIPDTFKKLSELKELYIDFNALTGKIPTWLGDLSKLERIEAGFNQLSGTIPSELGKLSDLFLLFLFLNDLSGTIPTELGKLSSVQKLVLQGNMLDGPIPSELGNLPELNTLDMRRNLLSGDVPSELETSSNMKYLLLSYNELEGSIPAELGDLSSLEYLWLEHNKLTGTIPSELALLSELFSVKLTNNTLIGTVAAEFGNLTSLREFDISLNENLEGVHPLLCDSANFYITSDFECGCCQQPLSYYGYGYGYGSDNSTSGNVTDDAIDNMGNVTDDDGTDNVFDA